MKKLIKNIKMNDVPFQDGQNGIRYRTVDFGEENYKLFLSISEQLPNHSRIIDIGTCRGNSAVALSYSMKTQNKTLFVDTYDIKKMVNPICEKFFKEYNLNYHIYNILENLEENKDKILSSNLIFFDIDPHEGVNEYNFYLWLKKNNYQGIIIYDDIDLGLGHKCETGYRSTKHSMKDFWGKIPEDEKIDITSVGHHSGTGIVYFNKHHKLLTENDKIFFIGFNKCATSTIHHLFTNSSYNVHGGYNWNLKDNNVFRDTSSIPFMTYDKSQKIIYHGDGNFKYQNGNIDFDVFKELYKNYPTSIYILNTRNLYEWLVSRCNHSKNGVNGKTWCYPYSQKLLIKWINDREFLYNKILKFFENKPNQLYILSIDENNWKYNLANKFNLKKLVQNYNKTLKIPNIEKNIKNIVNSTFDLLDFNETERYTLLLRDNYENKKYLKLYDNNIE